MEKIIYIKESGNNEVVIWEPDLEDGDNEATSVFKGWYTYEIDKSNNLHVYLKHNQTIFGEG